MRYSSIFAAVAVAGAVHASLPEAAPLERLHPRQLRTSDDKTYYQHNGVDTKGIGKRQQAQAGTAPSLRKDIRGVNLGGLFVYEPWIAQDTWNQMCGADTDSELACGVKLKQNTVDQKFQDHWANWYKQADFDAMYNYGINTVRIPVGFWMYEDIVHRDKEPYPRGGLKALANICKMAASKNLDIIIDHHAAPGAQAKNNPFAGEKTPNPQFYTTDNYNRGTEFLGWMTKQIYADQTSFGNVKMIQVLNEPLQGDGRDAEMISTWYPAAQKAIRDAEKAAGVNEGEGLVIQFMSDAWGSGDPTTSIDKQNTAYDDHRYVKWATNQQQNKEAYKQTSCNDNRAENGLSMVIGEWSMSAPLDDKQQGSADWDPAQNHDWYKGWFAAQANSYAKSTNGWIYWTWKTETKDPRWDYQLAVQQKIIPESLDGIAQTAQTWCGNSQTQGPGQGPPPGQGQ